MSSKISIICPTYNEEKYISACIASLIEQDISKEIIEVIFVDGQSTDHTVKIIQGYQQDYPWIKLLDNPERIVPYAMNKGIEAAKGDVIVRIDAHAAFPNNYVSELVKQLENLKADNVGTLCETLAANDTLVAQAIATALSSSFGMGNSYFRIGATDIMEVDTVPFGCFKKAVFDKVGLYDVELIRNQDDELNGRIIKNGGKIYLLPYLSVKYYARDTIKKVAKMFYQYGLYKPLVNKKLGSPATLRQFFPLFFVLGLLLGPIVGLFSSFLMLVYGLVIAIYFLLALFFGYKDSKNKLEVLVLPIIYFTIHFSYGWGYLVGIYKIIVGNKFSVEINR